MQGIVVAKTGPAIAEKVSAMKTAKVALRPLSGTQRQISTESGRR